MPDPKKRWRGWPVWITVGCIVVPLLYLLSLGPVDRLYCGDHISDEWWSWYTQPGDDLIIALPLEMAATIDGYRDWWMNFPDE